MKALTLWRPWTDAIFRWPGRHRKRIENRHWWPKWALGETIAIHAGQRYDYHGAEFIAELAEGAGVDWTVPGPDESPLGIVGLVTFAGVIGPSDDGYRSHRWIAGRRPEGFIWAEWWTGDIGWCLDDEVAIEPVPCLGAQGLWTVPGDLEGVVRQRWEEAKAA